jgi:eukaryotic-like serine/threonine-protein kinase
VFTAQLETDESNFESAARARIGTVVADTWKLDALVGLGGTGAVYRGRQRDGALVAIKVMHTFHLADKKTTERFAREASYANAINHPAVPRVFDDGRLADGCPYLVTELLEGRTLEEERLAAGGALHIEEVISVGFSVLEVLMKAHRKGIIHRDLKPQNLFRTRAGELKVLDFGLGRFTGPLRQGKAFTSVCMAMGTVGFMAPEQALGKHECVEATTDLWALGATLLMLATGLETHEAETPMGALSLAATKPVAPTASRSAMLMKEFCLFLDRALAFEQAQRFQSASAMRIALEEIHDRLGGSACTRIDSRPPVSIPPPATPHAEVPTFGSHQLGHHTLSGAAAFAPRLPRDHVGLLLARLRFEGIPRTRLSLLALVSGCIGFGMLLSGLLHR